MGAWYKEWYLVTHEGERQLRSALEDPVDGAQNRADVQKRLDELGEISDDRCHISRDQKRFLERMLADA